MNEIIIRHQPVELYKILKFEGLVASGGEAKQLIAQGMIALNGQIETQKRKKINAGDKISFGDEDFLIVLEKSNNEDGTSNE